MTTRLDFDTKFKSYKKGPIDKYIEQVGEKNKKRYYWTISPSATLLRIYHAAPEEDNDVTKMTDKPTKVNPVNLNNLHDLERQAKTDQYIKKPDVVVGECELHRYSGDIYYVVFPEKKILCWVNWFI